MEIVLLGHMGRDEAVADRLIGHKLHVIGEWENPGLVQKAHVTGGSFNTVDSIKNVEAIANCVESIQPDMFLTNFDDSLAAGVVDTIKDRVNSGRIGELLIPSPDKAASSVEWDKFDLRELIDEIDPKYNPRYFKAETPESVYNAVDFFRSSHTEIAIKPRNLTGGKGVKVQGKHFDMHYEGRKYALSILRRADQNGVLIEEKIEDPEFTLQIFTDGKTMIRPPVTYDYPYREDGDKGPGTGGMGTFTMKDGLLPFVYEADVNEAMSLMGQLLFKIKERGDDYRGVLYPTFFKTADGLKIVEVNARGGDPELINVVDLMENDVDLANVLKLIATGELETDSIRYRKLASAMIYLVSPEYGYGKGKSYDFIMDANLIKGMGVRIRFAAAERASGINQYRTVGSSRTVGLLALAAEPYLARNRIIGRALPAGFKHPMPLHFRTEIGEEDYVESLTV